MLYPLHYLDIMHPVSTFDTHQPLHMHKCVWVQVLYYHTQVLLRDVSRRDKHMGCVEKQTANQMAEAESKLADQDYV